MFDAAIIDYNNSNLFSVNAACKKVGLKSVITNDKKIIMESKSIILPGVGSFNIAMKSLIDMKLNRLILDFYKKEKPILGICLGMQLLFKESFEFVKTEGLNLLEGQVIKLNKSSGEGLDCRVPHIGWSRINIQNNKCNSLLEGIDKNAYMYFVHSFKVNVFQKKIITSKVNYGSNIINSSIEHKKIYATQFHPEKSGDEGLKIYKNFKKIIDESNYR